MAKTASCLDCGASFAVRSGRHVRCTPCGQRHIKEWRKAWFKQYRHDNNEYFLEYARRRRREAGVQPFESRERENRRLRRQAILAMFDNCCALCGYNRATRSLHVHHRDPSRKRGDKDYQRKAFDDFANLIVLCANCHFEVHDGLATIPPPTEPAIS